MYLRFLLSEYCSSLKSVVLSTVLRVSAARAPTERAYYLLTNDPFNASAQHELCRWSMPRSFRAKRCSLGTMPAVVLPELVSTDSTVSIATSDLGAYVRCCTAGVREEGPHVTNHRVAEDAGESTQVAWFVIAAWISFVEVKLVPGIEARCVQLHVSRRMWNVGRM